jgi:biotin-(acetyl-CoA carboxylase) ligase
VIGIGVNGEWARSAFPADLSGSMTSLRELAARPIEHGRLLEAFLEHLEPRVMGLREGWFDGPGWSARQATTDRDVDLVDADGSRVTIRATGVDTETGALLVEGRSVLVGAIAHVRLTPQVAAPGGV